MANDRQEIIAVFGATGQQGGGVVAALRARGRYRVRAITRSPEQVPGLADEVVRGDLTQPETLPAALRGAYGVFAVTNAWAGPGVDELAQGTAAVTAAREVGVEHFVWSTLPNVERIAGGRFDVAHFTQKARVDDVVAGAGFAAHTFVEAPFYYQNLTGAMAPQPGPDGRPTWNVPMDPAARVIHAGDITELGTVVAGAFEHRDRVGGGDYLSHAGDLLSWNDIVAVLADLGHDVRVNRVPDEVYDGFFPGAREIRHMLNYFEAHSYFGPDAAAKIERARAVATRLPTDFRTWAQAHMPALA